MGQIWEVTIEQQFLGQLLNNVLHFEERTTAQTPASIATELNGFFLPQMRTVQATIMTYTKYYIRKVPSTGEEATPVLITPSQNGGISIVNAFLPMCMLWQLRGNPVTRSSRGRFYIGAVNAGQASGTGRWTSSYITTAQTAAANLRNRFGMSDSPSPLKWGIYSKKYSSIFPLDEIRVRDVPAIQKRRNLLIGD